MVPLQQGKGQEVVVLGFQGNVAEHVEAVSRAMARLSLSGRVRAATDEASIRGATALAIPGGESTTISRLVAHKGLKDAVVSHARAGKPILGTCAGLILLARTVDGRDKTHDPGFPAVMDVAVSRNAWGRQRESFETEVEIKLPGLALTETGIFIRAPIIEGVRGDCVPVASVDGTIVAALQGKMLGTCFHPELSENSRIYEFLLGSLQGRR